MWKLIAPVALIVLAACDAPSRAPSDFAPVPSYGSAPGEAVQVQVQIARSNDPMTAHARTQITADRVCGRHNRRAQYQTRRDMMNQNWEDVFMCR